MSNTSQGLWSEQDFSAVTIAGSCSALWNACSKDEAAIRPLQWIYSVLEHCFSVGLVSARRSSYCTQGWHSLFGAAVDAKSVCLLLSLVGRAEMPEIYMSHGATRPCGCTDSACPGWKEDSNSIGLSVKVMPMSLPRCLFEDITIPTEWLMLAALHAPHRYGDVATDGHYRHWDHEVLPHWDARIRNKHAYGHKFQPPGNIHSPYYPHKGPYSSSDPHVIRAHIQEMTDAKITVMVGAVLIGGIHQLLRETRR